MITPKLSDLVLATDIYYLLYFLWDRNSRASWLDGPGSETLMRWQSSEGLTGARGCTLRCLTHIVGKLVQAVSRKPSFLSLWTPAQVSLSS